MDALQRFICYFRFLIVVSGLFSGNLKAQGMQQQALPMALRAGAFYDFPQSFGLQFALDRPFQVRSRTVIRCDGRIRHKRSVWMAGGEIGAYRYAFNHSGVWLTGTLARQTGGAGRFALETRLGQGVLRTFYDGKVYVVDHRGKVVERPLGGRWYALTQLAIQPGWRLGAAGNTRLFIEPALWLQYPYNSFVLPHAALSAGVEIDIPKWAKTASVHSFTKRKKPCAH